MADDSRVHVALAGTDWAACGVDGGEVVPVDEALRAGGRHFDCADCHKVLTGGRKHSAP